MRDGFHDRAWVENHGALSDGIDKLAYRIIGIVARRRDDARRARPTPRSTAPIG